MSQTCCNCEEKKPSNTSKRQGSQITIPVGGMHCPSCALNIEKSLLCVSGVTDANVNFMREEVTVQYDPYRVDVEKIKKAITKPGFIIRETLWEKTRAYWSERIFFIQMVSCAALVIAASMINFLRIAPEPILWNLTLSNLFSLAVVALGGYPILKGALQALFVRDLTVFSLVSVASIAAVLVGAYNEAAMVILIMLVGETLEKVALRKSRDAISKLINLAPASALVRRNGQETEMPADKVTTGDIVIIKPGARLPVDGVIVKGEAAINESTLTGESLPQDKKEGDNVYSGTINESGAFEIKATKIGDDTRFALIKRLILEAESGKAPIQRIADRYARYFVPIIMAFSVLVLLITGNWYTAITVLIVACPCALVLATPTAVVTGLANASRQGILIKGGQYLEALGGLNALLIDKTGTLTTGKLSVTDIVPLNGTSEKEVLEMAALAEKRSEHPIAQAVINKANQEKLSVSEPDTFELFKGSGVRVTQNNPPDRRASRTILVGNSRLLAAKQVGITEEINKLVSGLESQGKSTLLVVDDTAIKGIIALSDVAKPGASLAIKRLKDLGFNKITCITGDNSQVALAITKEVGLDESCAQMLPEDKVNKVKELKAQGFKVGMVGDGVNDAPALAGADVGIAMGAFGSDVAIESSDVSLMKDDLNKIPDAIALSRRALNVIKQNFIFAIGYNLIMLVLVTQFVREQHNMVWGAVAHQFSSLLVVLSSMRLLR